MHFLHSCRGALVHLGQGSAALHLLIITPCLKEILSAWHGRIPKMFSLRAAFDASSEYYYITERNQKLKCLRVQLIYPNRKCFLKNYSAIFIANLSQTQNWINRICSFKTNFFFFFLIMSKNTFFAFIHQLILPPPQPLSMPAACGSPEICTDGISTLGVFTLKHIPGQVGR